MGSHPIIASYRAPKQRLTVEYVITMIHNTAGDTYSVGRSDMDLGIFFEQTNWPTKEEAWEIFKIEVTKALEYGTETWEETSHA